MRYLILVAVVGALVGCESSVVDQAAAECEDAGWSRSEVLEALVVLGEQARDTGWTKDEMTNIIAPQYCFPISPEGMYTEAYWDCIRCVNALLDAVYGE